MRLINADRIEYKGKCMTPTGIVERSYIENMPAVDLLLKNKIHDILIDYMSEDEAWNKVDEIFMYINNIEYKENTK